MDLHNKIFIHHGTKHLDQSIEYHNRALTNKIIDEIKEIPYMQGFYNKDINGLWCCRYTPGNKYNSAWERFAASTNLRRKEELNKFFIFKLNTNANILIIDNAEDIKNLESKYVYYEENRRKNELFKILIETPPSTTDYQCLMEEYFKSKDIILLNAGNISKDFDGIFVTDNAIHQLRDAFSLWDIETLLLFNTNVINNININIE